MPDNKPNDEPEPGEDASPSNGSTSQPGGKTARQSGGVNIDGDTGIDGNVIGRDSITTHTTNTTHASTTVMEGGPVARYAVLGVVGIAALAIIVLGLIAFGSHPPAPTATPTASATPSPIPTLTPSRTSSPTALPPTDTATSTNTATATPLPPTGTPSPTLPPTSEITATEPTLTPSATATDASTAPVLTPTPLPTSALPLYDNFASTCLRKDNWMLDVAWQAPTPTPGAPICLETRPEYMAADDGLVVFLDPSVTSATGETHFLTTASSGFFKQIEVRLTLNNVEVFTDTRAAYLSVAASVKIARPADADLEVRVQGGNTAGKFGYQVTSILNLKDGSGNVGGEKMVYSPGQPIIVAFRVKGNKLTAYVNDQPIAGPFSILTEPYAVTIGYHADAQTSLDGSFDEVRIAAITASEIRPAPIPTPP